MQIVLVSKHHFVYVRFSLPFAELLLAFRIDFCADCILAIQVLLPFSPVEKFCELTEKVNGQNLRISKASLIVSSS